MKVVIIVSNVDAAMNELPWYYKFANIACVQILVTNFVAI